MLTYDPEMRPSIFDVLKDDYFKNIGAASRWEMLRDRVLKFPEADESPELQKHPENIKFLANGTVAPKWALEVFKHRETGFFKNWAPDTRAANRDRRNIFLDAAKRLLVLGTRRFGQGTADTTEVLFAALEFLRWYFVRAPMDILGESWARDRYGALTAACMRLAGMYRTFGRGGSAVEYRGSWRSQTLGDGTMCLTEESIYMEQRRVLEMLDYNLAMSSIFDCAVQHARDKIPGNIWTSAEALFLKCVAICAAARVVEHTSIFYSQSYIALSCCDYVGLGMDETSVPPKRDAEKVEVFKQITRTLRARLAAEDDLLIRAWSSHSPEAVAGLRDIVKKMASMYPE